MKIVAIRGKNLASLEGEFEVDFTVEPLRSAGIFAITGSTGSGKSTLLDAICLALFNDTPRIHNASDKEQIVDGRHKSISQKDSRTLLRRGTSDGYAEVDFVALSGENIRARWSVRRSRDKVDGSLQNTTYRVYNLTTESELQGGKIELLTKVRELIGLTFDQFTRSVLLAQGDFATFLKAGKNDKAELLEKLTGTDIYSRISTKIYENTKEAEAKLSLITERIKDVEILTPEQMTELLAEQVIKASEVAKLDGELDILSKKIEWYKTDEQLKRSLSITQEELSQSEIAIEDAKPRFDYIACVDSVQEIRDDFKQLLNDRREIEVDNVLFTKQQERNKIDLLTLATIDKNLKTYKEEQTTLDGEWQMLEPQIREARKLDIQLVGHTNNIDVVNKELEQLVSQNLKFGKKTLTIKGKITIIDKSQKRILGWFESNKIYSDIVPRIDIIASCLDDLKLTQNSITQKRQEIEFVTDLMSRETIQLERQMVEEHRLNEILPSEIIALRAKLVDNEPCSVCGSTHHPVSGVNVDSLEEKALNEAKEIVAKDINRLTQSVAFKKEQITLYNSLIVSNNEQYDKLFEKLSEWLKDIPEWGSRYSAGTLSKELQVIVKLWQNNTIQQTSLREQLNTQHQESTVNNERLVEVAKLIADKETRRNRIAEELCRLNKERKSLLNGEDTDKIESIQKTKIKECTDNVISITADRDTLNAKCEKASGIVAQIENRIRTLTRNIIDLDNSVTTWLSKSESELTFNELTQLLSNDNNWLIIERQSLDLLSKSKLSAQATLLERQRMLTEHNKALIKPSEEENQDTLFEVQNSQKDLFRNCSERKAEIGVILVNHEKGKKRISKFEKELEDKGAIAENWRKLNDLFGSADGAKFKVLAQGYTLDVLLGYANKHLKEISLRYVLERVSPESLALQVVDLDMFSEVRSVHSLSGGESFLISLALALGLSSLSSNKMSVESLFIDEGFGTLDAETLRVAMDALESLQTQGRKIGVISHVAEMTARISTQIKVVKNSNGRSHIEVV